MAKLTLEKAVKDLLDAIDGDYVSSTFAPPIPEKIRVLRKMMRKLSKLDTQTEDDVRPMDIECPKCKAGPGDFCKKVDGSYRLYLHVERKSAAL